MAGNAQQVERFVKPEQAASIKTLDRIQIWLLCAHYVTRDIGFRVQAGEVYQRLGVTEEQGEAVSAILDHYSVGIAVRAISPAGVVGELTSAKLKPEYAVLLGDAADEIAHGLRILNKSQSYFVAAHLDAIEKGLASIECVLKVEPQHE